MAAGNTYVAIATQTADGSTAVFDFSSIPQTYTDLVLVIGGSTGSAPPFVRFNSNTSTVYSSTRLNGLAGGVNTGRRTRGDGGPNDTRLEIGVGSNSEAVDNTFYIMNYSNTTTFTVVLCRANQVTTADVKFSVGTFHSTSAITDIRVGNTNSANLTSGTVISLYGIAAA